MVPPIMHILCLRVRAAAGYGSVVRCYSLSSFISLKYVYSWLIACYCSCSLFRPCLVAKFFFELSTFLSQQNFPTYTNFQLFYHIVPISTKLLILVWSKHNLTLFLCIDRFLHIRSCAAVRHTTHHHRLSKRSRRVSRRLFLLSTTVFRI
jgi:hypothetical protein